MNAEREAQIRRDQVKWGEQLNDLASMIETMGRACLEDDEILGCIAGQGVANHLSALPKHIRDVFMEHLSDEAAAGFATDQRYYAFDTTTAPQSSPTSASDFGRGGGTG